MDISALAAVGIRSDNANIPEKQTDAALRPFLIIVTTTSEPGLVPEMLRSGTPWKTASADRGRRSGRTNGRTHSARHACPTERAGGLRNIRPEHDRECPSLVRAEARARHRRGMKIGANEYVIKRGQPVSDCRAHQDAPGAPGSEPRARESEERYRTWPEGSQRRDRGRKLISREGTSLRDGGRLSLQRVRRARIGSKRV